MKCETYAEQPNPQAKQSFSIPPKCLLPFANPRSLGRLRETIVMSSHIQIYWRKGQEIKISKVDLGRQTSSSPNSGRCISHNYYYEGVSGRPTAAGRVFVGEDLVEICGGPIRIRSLHPILRARP